eukprot:jgi/Botrbrau1/6456/Bobra.0034s0031.1
MHAKRLSTLLQGSGAHIVKKRLYSLVILPSCRRVSISRRYYRHSCRYSGKARSATASTGSLEMGVEGDQRPPAKAGGLPVKEEPQGMENAAQLLQNLSEIPTIKSASCISSPSESGFTLAVHYAQRNLLANAMRQYICSYNVSAGFMEPGQVAPRPSLPLELKDVLLVSQSPSGKKVLLVRAGSGETEAAILEVWGASRLLKELRVPKTLHGSIFNDGWFGKGACWSPDESKLAYTAEVPASVRTPEWGVGGGTSATEGSSGTSAAAPKGWRGVGPYEEDWGELFTGKRDPSIFVLDLATWSVSPLPSVPSKHALGQPCFLPSGQGVVYVGWPTKAHNFASLPEKLGIVYCVNRPCHLFLSLLEDAAAGPEQREAICLTPKQSSALSPIFNPMGSRLVYLSHEAAVDSGVHCATAALYQIPWGAEGNAAVGPPKVVVPVDTEPKNDPLRFPGLATTSLKRLFLDERRLLVNTQWRSYADVVLVDLESSAVVPASPRLGPQGPAHMGLGSWTCLDANERWAVAEFSAPNKPSQLYISTVSGTEAVPAWYPLPVVDDPYPETVTAALDGISFETLQVNPQTEPTDVGFEVVVIKGAGNDPAPGILFPHGGPHSAYAASFMIPLAFLASLGYTVLAVNFRGSTGFGQRSILSLPGQIGTNDVSDCMAAISAAAAEGWVDTARVSVVGGSHGGFLAGMLVGQHPGSFQAAVLRNPVLDISLMAHVTDIPDWCFVETWGTQEGKKRAQAKPTSEDIERFRRMSPIAHVDKVTTPLLFFLGAKDRRVPLVDSHSYVAAIRARSDAPPVSVFVFPEDTHALDKPRTEFEQWVNVASWLKKYL